MVGVPRSTGCERCRKRRVKCDEGRPGCGNCSKYGVDCPGYDRGFKFVAGKHAVRPRKQKSGEVPEQVLDFSGVSREVVSSPKTPPGRSDRPLAMTISPTEDRAQFVCTMIQNIRSDQTHMELMFLNQWFALIPGRIGRRITMDSAMCALTMHLLGKGRQDAVVLGNAQSLYGQSLVALQKALSHPTEWKATETLCSAILLCTYELFAGTGSSDSWMNHASGLSRLMEARGPAAHEEGLDAAMLISFRGIIIMNDMFSVSNKDCFLVKKAWKRVSRDGGRYLTVGDETPIEWIHAIDGYNAILAHVPRILHYGFLVREAKRHAIVVDPAKIAELAKHAAVRRQELIEWEGFFSSCVDQPTLIPAQDPSSIYENVYQFQNPWIGTFFLGYWATLLILQETLNQCGYHVDYSDSNRELVRNIFMSVETVSVGFMGPFRLGYSIRIAYDFADVKAQTWVRMWLDRFNKIYAATDKAVYPTTPNEYGYS